MGRRGRICRSGAFGATQGSPAGARTRPSPNPNDNPNPNPNLNPNHNQPRPQPHSLKPPKILNQIQLDQPTTRASKGQGPGSNRAHSFVRQAQGKGDAVRVSVCISFALSLGVLRFR